MADRFDFTPTSDRRSARAHGKRFREHARRPVVGGHDQVLVAVVVDVEMVRPRATTGSISAALAEATLGK